MSSVIPAPIARQPWSMLTPLILLTCFGAAVLYSAAGGSFTPFASSHLIRFGIFMVVALVIAAMPRDFVKLVAYPAYVGILLLLVAVEAAGAMGGGSQRWLEVGPIRLQPSELMKPAIALALARFYDTLPTGMIGSWRALVPAGVIIALPVGLVLMQPDLGTALAILFSGAVVMFLAGLPMSWFLSAGAAGAIAVPRV